MFASIRVTDVIDWSGNKFKVNMKQNIEEKLQCKNYLEGKKKQGNELRNKYCAIENYKQGKELYSQVLQVLVSKPQFNGLLWGDPE